MGIDANRTPVHPAVPGYHGIPWIIPEINIKSRSRGLCPQVEFSETSRINQKLNTFSGGELSPCVNLVNRLLPPSKLIFLSQLLQFFCLLSCTCHISFHLWPKPSATFISPTYSGMLSCFLKVISVVLPSSSFRVLIIFERVSFGCI